ncbi:endosome/lysosome-associated apoptosis and autophagy regulator family member 2-like isoform X2 [Ostrea edulis]|uniref:endosome/lysosome-associated apoptosis and autophagy regulator family member 2-like isoform X2 n=1 Tax=Ostrea edulis TaxID=37623 RepID=UPI0024AF152E|nr:endosome/lysosome-associated apoptosis and autophagy regulator family member 2-like isoform X2 [Ostrea edulis]
MVVVQGHSFLKIPEKESGPLSRATPSLRDVRLEVHLTSGPNVLIWKTVSLLSESSSESERSKPILIRKMEIDGVAFTSECSKCKNGTHSSEGAAYCSTCGRNSYSLKGQATCTGCDLKSEYSERGASSCLKRPACTTKDYYEEQAPCVKKKTRKIYKWLEPQICRTDLSSAAKLPKPSPLEDCPPCNPGMHFVEGKGCEFCPDNMYSDGAKSCQTCSANTSPNIGLEFKWWNQMPVNMSGNCLTFGDLECSSNASWVLAGDHIHTQFGRNRNSYLVLILKVDGFRGQESPNKDITVGTVEFQFETKCNGNCELIFLSDEYGSNGIVKSWTGTEKKQQFRHEIKTTQALALTWAFQSSDESDDEEDVARIYSVKVTNTVTGGATDCQKCMTEVKDNQCIPCPAGHFFDSNTTQCLPCPFNAVIRTRLAWGEDSCVKCGPGLSAKDGTACVSDCTYTDEANRKYDFTSLKSPKFVSGANLFTGSGTGYYHGFNISLCAGDTAKALCQNNMTSEGENNEKPVHSMVCRSAMVPTKEKQIVSTQPVSIGDYLTKILTNQSHDSELHQLYEKGGIPTDGMERDVHFFYKTDKKTQACPKGRKTIVTLQCDLTMDGEGVIKLPLKCPDGTCDGCMFHFLWKSQQACPPCLEKDIQIIVGECLNGIQTVHYSAPNYCKPAKDIKSKEQRKCRLKLAALPFVLKVSIPSVVGVGILLFICVIYCWMRNKKLEYKYMKLVEGSGPNYDGELPGVDSCALEDGEEEQFDTVSFSETKKKGLFSKLRGKKYKSHDDNPFETSHTEKLPLT